MSEYGSGLTFGQTRNMDKERIKHALCGELMCGEDEKGFVYAKATSEECAAYILSAYDDCVYHAKQAMDNGRALERLMKSKGVECTPEEYGALMEAARLEFDDYQYENPDNDAPIGFDETPPETDEEKPASSFIDGLPEIVIQGGSTGASTKVMINGKDIPYLDAVRFETAGGELSKVTLTFVPKSVTIRTLGELMEYERELIPSARQRGNADDKA